MVPILISGAPPANNQVAVFQSAQAGEPVGASNVFQDLLFGVAVANGLKIVNNAGSFVLPTGNYLIDAWGNVDDGASDVSSLQLDLKVGGTSVWPGFNHPITDPANALTGDNHFLSLSWFYASNGVTPVTFPIAASMTTTAGSTFYGNVRFVAI